MNIPDAHFPLSRGPNISDLFADLWMEENAQDIPLHFGLGPRFDSFFLFGLFEPRGSFSAGDALTTAARQVLT